MEILDEIKKDYNPDSYRKAIILIYFSYILVPIVFFIIATLIILSIFAARWMEFTELGVFVCAFFQLLYSLLALFILKHLSKKWKEHPNIRNWTLYLPLLSPIIVLILMSTDLGRSLNRIDLIFLVTAIFNIFNPLIQLQLSKFLLRRTIKDELP